MILITGGLGYLGGRLSKVLISKGFKVRITTSRTNPLIPTELSSCEIIKIDLTNISSIDKACKGIKTIIHLASLNSSQCERSPKEAENINTFGTLNLLKSAKKNLVKKFLYFSTAHVYGSNLNGVITENSPTLPLNAYALSHKAAEDFVINFNTEGELNTSIFRLTNVVGSPLSQYANCWMLIANDLCRKIASNEKVILHSDKLTTRDFITIDDLLESTIFYINAKNPLMGGEVINISSGVPLSLEYLSNLLKDRASIILNKKINIEFKNLSNKKADNLFSISNQKAVDFGMTFNNSLLFEIDSMLLKYESWFGDFPAQ